MTVLDLMDRVRAGQYRSDRFPSVPYTTLAMAMQHAQDVLTVAEPNGQEVPGTITPSCSDRSRVEVVAKHVGIGLRIGCEVNLCFACGPDGGHYHPSEGETMDSVMAVAARILNPETIERD